MYLRRRRCASRARGTGRASTVLGGRRERTTTNEPRLVSNSAITLQLVLSVDDTEYPRFRGGEVLLGLRGVRRLFPRDLGERLALLLPLDPSNPVAVEEVLLRLLCDPAAAREGRWWSAGKKRDSRGIAATKSGVLDGRVDVGRAFGRRAARTHLSSLLTVSCHVRISRVEPLPRDIFLVPVRVEVCAVRESNPSETTHRED